MDLTLYEVLLFAHLSFVSIWVGGDAMLQALALRAQAAGPEETTDFMKAVEWVGMRVLTPASALVVAFGVWLVLNSPAWDFSQTWVTLGLAVFLLSFITGAGFLGPESGRLGKLMEERPPDDPEVQRRIRRIVLISRTELVLLVAVIFDMVVKPGL